jgi:hypothetical protein
MGLPTSIRAGDTVLFEDGPFTTPDGRSIDPATWTLTYYFRTAEGQVGASAVGVADGVKWDFTVAASTTGSWVAGQWYYQAVATLSTEKFTVRDGKFTVLATMEATASSGVWQKFDGRTQAKKDLDAVQAAIRAMISGGAVSEYTIGNRSLKKIPMPDLLLLESRLKAIVARENRAQSIANGLGNPQNVFVRFKGQNND